MENASATCDAERLAVKAICVSDIFSNVLALAKDLQILDKRLTRYIKQMQLLLTWRRSTAALKMAGSAAKTVSSLMVFAAPFCPKLKIALNFGHRLWRFGASLKILNMLANVVRDLWQNGFRKCLLDFSRSAASLTKNLGVLDEVISDLQQTTRSLNLESIPETPRQLFNIIRPYIPQSQLMYAAHVCSIFFGAQRYSPMFAFAALLSDPANKSPSMQLIRELESLHFTEFIEDTSSKSLQVISTLLHFSREVIDFLDGFQQFTDKDCVFLQDCLVKFTQESKSILKVVSLLVSLDTSRTVSKKASSDNDSSILNTPPPTSKESEALVEPVPATDANFVSKLPVENIANEADVMEVDLPSCVPRPSHNNTHPSPIDNPHSTDDSEAKEDSEANKGHNKIKAAVGAQRALLSLSDLMKRSGSALLSVSVQRKVTKETTSQFQDRSELTRI